MSSCELGLRQSLALEPICVPTVAPRAQRASLRLVRAARDPPRRVRASFNVDIRSRPLLTEHVRVHDTEVEAACLRLPGMPPRQHQGSAWGNELRRRITALP